MASMLTRTRHEDTDGVLDAVDEDAKAFDGVRPDPRLRVLHQVFNGDWAPMGVLGARAMCKQLAVPITRGATYYGTTSRSGEGLAVNVTVVRQSFNFPFQYGWGREGET